MANITKVSSFEEALATLTEALSVREKELDAREERLKQHQERLDDEHSLAYGNTSPCDVLHLNVGGTKTTVLRRTLTSVPESMLASRFSGRWDDNIEKDKDGDFFVDQDFFLFNDMLIYLRNKANGDDKFPMKSPEIVGEKRDDFYRMVEYYGMTNGIYPTTLTPFHPSDSLEMLGYKKVNAKKWATFELSLDGHARKVKTFEVTLGEVQRIQIGWTTSSSFSRPESDDLGVGEILSTFALDLTRSSFLEKRSSSSGQSSTPVEGLEHPKGTVVLAENYGTAWYVNGNLVLDASEKNMSGKDGMPLISVKGEIEITSVELDIEFY